ncbi:MAG: fasciclin domain-containing protein [Chitinophagaceae bacterium]|nr:fasciclin domain-containing protein [Chitinophagaceae bacterium]
MKLKVFKYISIAFTASAFFILWGCTKKEYMPPEVGEKIPYNDTVYAKFDDVLETSPYTLFYQAWTRSNMEQRLSSGENANRTFTFLVPGNEAFTAAGWDAGRIANALPPALDTLLMRYVLQQDISPEDLSNRSSSQIISSFLSFPGVRYSDGNLYFLKAALALDGGTLVLNGKKTGAAQSLATDRGHIWPIQDTLAFIPRSAWEVLKTDGRFSLYTRIIEYTDSVYNDIFYKANGYRPETADSRYFVAKTYYRNTPRQQGMALYRTDYDDDLHMENLNTWFIPTDEAFHKAGFHTLQDLVTFNEQRGIPDTVRFSYIRGHGETGNDWQDAFYAINGFFATDSILDYHSFWGMRNGTSTYWASGEAPSIFYRSNGYPYWQGRNSLIIFSNDFVNLLRPDLNIASYYYQWTYSLSLKDTYKHDAPLVASSAGKVQVPGLEVNEVTISGPDMYTLNGVIHVVDNLFQPSIIP